MEYQEWENLKIIEDKNNPFSTLFELDTKERFYIEPAFYTQLTNFVSILPMHHDKIIEKMKQLVIQNKKVVFTLDYESPLTKADGYVYLEITDVTDPLGIYVEDKSRGSDYGD